MLRRLLLFCLCCATCLAVRAADDGGVEDKIKAAYLFNFLRFAEWPALDRTAPNAPLRLCVIGSEGLGQLLGELGNRDINGHPLVVDTQPTFSSRRQAQCQVLYIDRRVAGATPVEQLPRENVLTVSDAPGFAETGGIIGFYREDGRIRIAINLRRAREARLILSARLLEVARIVD